MPAHCRSRVAAVGHHVVTTLASTNRTITRLGLSTLGHPLRRTWPRHGLDASRDRAHRTAGRIHGTAKSARARPRALACHDRRRVRTHSHSGTRSSVQHSNGLPQLCATATSLLERPCSQPPHYATTATPAASFRCERPAACAALVPPSLTTPPSSSRPLRPAALCRWPSRAQPTWCRQTKLPCALALLSPCLKRAVTSCRLKRDIIFLLENKKRNTLRIHVMSMK